MDREAWWLQSVGSQRVGHDLATEQHRVEVKGDEKGNKVSDGEVNETQ